MKQINAKHVLAMLFSKVSVYMQDMEIFGDFFFLEISFKLAHFNGETK